MDMLSRGSMQPVRNSVDIVNAVAAAIVTAEGRTHPPPDPRRKWTDCLKMYFCFGSQKNGRRINRAALVPEPILDQPTPPAFPFVAPPSSPASLLQSDTTSNIQSPNFPSPTGTPSIFAIGPYAYETQLVSPPEFSDSTEPSTAPFTPPPVYVHVKTPSSPEVPYAEILTSINNSNSGERGNLQSYPNYPDNPITHSISPRSGFCGSYSPFPNPEMPASSHYAFPSFPVRETPKILDGEGVATQNLIHRHMSNGGSPFDGDITSGAPVAYFSTCFQPSDHAMNRQVSFELTVEGVKRCLEKKNAISRDSATPFHLAPTSSGDHKRESNHRRAELHDEMYHDLLEKVRRSLSLHQAREFNLNDAESTNPGPSVGSDWWANDKVAGISAEPEKGMSLDPVSQPGSASL